MAQVWIPSFKKRVMLGALDLFARVTRRPRPKPTRSTKSVERILVIELWNIGDIVLAMPFLAQLRRLFPQAKITMLARPYARTILAGTDLVDEFIETELGWSERSVRRNPFAYHWVELARVRRALQRGRFDIAFSSRMHVREYLLLAFSGAERRVAFGLGHGERVLTDAIPPGDLNRHKVGDWLELLKPFGESIDQAPPRLKVSEGERRWATAFLAKHGVSTEDRLVGVHPGASVQAKRWPLERFAEVATAVGRMAHAKVIAFVAPDGFGDQLSQVPGVIGAKVNLRELIALVECCDVLVCNDSGPMHIAGALGIPTVSVFGSGINRWFSPLGDGHHLLTAERDASALREDPGSVTPFDVAGVDTSDVLAAVSEVLGIRATVHP
jgi:ADP-heptose:LPS heptosyltransferase